MGVCSRELDVASGRVGEVRGFAMTGERKECEREAGSGRVVERSSGGYGGLEGVVLDLERVRGGFSVAGTNRESS